MMSRVGRSLGAGFLALACLVAPRARAEESPHPPTPTSLEELEARIDQIRVDRGIPGVALALVDRDSVLWTAGLGLADLEHGTPVTDSTLFRLGSVGKSFLGLAFQRLAEAGGVDLGTPVREVAPEIAIDNPWADTDPVRIVHLLEHTAGFDDLHFNELYSPEATHLSLGDGLAVNPASRRVRWRPGTVHSYSSPGYAVAGYVLESLTGEPYEEYLERELLRPIGMVRSAAGVRVDASRHDLARGYTGDPPRPVPRYRMYLRPAGDLDASAADMAAFLQFMLSRGRVGDRVLISQAGIERAETPTTGGAVGAGLGSGYGLGIGSRYQDGVRMFGHNGSVGGFIASYWYEPDAGLGFAVMVNSDTYAGAREIRDLVWSFLTRELPPHAPPPHPLTTAELEAFSGSYELVSQRMQLLAPVNSMLAAVTLSVKDGALVMRELGEEPTELIPVSTRSFRKAPETEATLAFGADDEGRTMLFTRRDTYRRAAPWRVPLHRAFVVGSLLLIASTVVYGIFWAPLALYRRFRGQRGVGPGLALRLLPLLGALSLLGGGFGLSRLSLAEIGQANPGTVAFFLGTILFALLSVSSLVAVVASARRSIGRLLRAYAGMVTLASVAFAAYLSWWGVIGLRLWAY